MLKYIVLCCLIMLFFSGCGNNSPGIMECLEAQQRSIGQCEARNMQFVGARVNNESSMVIICRTLSPLKYYEFKIK